MWRCISLVCGSTHFRGMCCYHCQVFKVHKQMSSSWTLLQNTSNHSPSNPVSHPIIAPLQKTQNLQGTYLPSDIGHIIIGHPLFSFIGIWTNPAVWVSYWHISLWLDSMTNLQADDRYNSGTVKTACNLQLWKCIMKCIMKWKQQNNKSWKSQPTN